MVERRIELDRRYQRKKKMHKLKAKLIAAPAGPDREKILEKIKRISPWWTEASLKPVAPEAPKAEAEAAKEPKKPKAPPKPKPEKKA
ncbi:DUF6800 family protein [Fimbriiglobus ruber]|uniref:Uncharacterized protein n=1 Tax=Fimbriiglobus ruber TaxID=1908690 RepID=A0A225D965_9BACT|nr:DUF6800 family protein [Fimbriiglobus ruber]OWK38002.1 hypothetical protein FRUB_07122 [Fimbriiglobus ruber]